MEFIQTSLPDAYLVEVEKFVDERGFFARSWCEDEFAAHGLPRNLAQTSISFNHRKGTLRGMHFAAAPSREGKIVRCTAGAILDVIIDLRPDSPAFLQHIGVELNAESRKAIYIPPGFAHGFQTLMDNTEILYMMTERYRPEHASGFRWNDPAFGITWPADVSLINDRDDSYPDFDKSEVEGFRGYYPAQA